MRALITPLAGIITIAVASGLLGWYGYARSQDSLASQRQVALETMGELATEKVLNIEYTVTRADQAIFESIDPENPSAVREKIKSEKAAVTSVLILDEKLQPTPGGYFSKRSRPNVFLDKVFPHLLKEMAVEATALSEPTYRHLVLGDIDLLFVYKKLKKSDKTYYLILEHDISYLVGFVFPKYFDIESRHIYRIVNETGALVYGRTNPISHNDRDVAEIIFSRTLARWKVRVTHKAETPSGVQNIAFDLLMISGALLVILCGLYALFVTVRRERRANELKSEFVANVSHELRTPLSIVRMYGELLKSGKVDRQEQITDFGAVIEKESTRLTQLIENLLDFSRIDQGKSTFSLAPQRLKPLLEKLVEIASPSLRESNLNVVINADDVVVQIDESSLTLAVLNVLENAGKYAASGEKIEIFTHLQGKKLSLHFRDYGPGVAKNELTNLFSRFVRGSDTEGTRGSGIGLSLVKQVAKAHGGKVTARNANPGLEIIMTLILSQESEKMK